ncbi:MULTISPECIES: hypothetical protein [Streptomyces]|uniref:hypothetical protein n=1 Tax=Streptomyces TaxID=1883 RepID=UPI0004CC908C|nr:MULTISPECIES: hypothetical protein [Streptomyces]KOT60720.1 hypothetical protein ADK43_13680 [Streptomyces rimosus subsp. rimosus]
MAFDLANEIPSRLLMWQRVREYAVPPSMIETAAARRAAGDWAGACAAARIDVDLDLRAVRDRHGTGLVTRLRADLRRLAPDLLRWHMPRVAPDGRLRPGLTVCLARYGGSGPTSPQLVVRTPPAWADAGQRMSLALWEGAADGAPVRSSHPHPHPARRFRLDLHRHLWDAGRSGELAQRCGAGEMAPPDPLLLPDRFDNSPWVATNWAAEGEILLRDEGRARGAFTVRLGARNRVVLELVAPDDSHAPTLRPLRDVLPPQEVAALPVLPEAAARILPDLELLRAGLVTAERLHPLVAAALTAPGPAPAESAPAPVAGPAPAPADPHRVECRGEVHRIALRDGVLTAIDHDPAQLRREELLVALGGPGLPCLRAIDAVHRNPEALPAVRERLRHGDVVGALDVVEGLLGPGAVLRDGPLREELESAAARRIDHGLFRSGLVAEHPDAGTAVGQNGPGVRHAKTGHRPRLNRHMPRALGDKRGSLARPRTGLFR